MSDLHERFHRLGRDVAGLSPPSPVELRRVVERRRNVRRSLTGAAAVIVVLTVVAVTRLAASDDPTRLVVAPVPTPTVTPSTASSPSPTRVAPWLAAPWVLDSSTTLTWAAGRPGSYRFCELRPYVPAAPFDVEVQRLTHPDGRRALLLKLSSAEGGWQVWKWAYAECRKVGRSLGDEEVGSRVLWSYGAVAAGLQVVGPHPLTAEEAMDSDAYILELTGPSPTSPATRGQVSALMNVWAGTGPEE